jgi:hypothetical protein
MTRQEVAKLLAMVAARYPNSKIWGQDKSLTINVWFLTLGDMPYPAVERAMIEYFKMEKWAPDPSDLGQGALVLLESCRTPEERLALDPEWQRTSRRAIAGERDDLPRCTSGGADIKEEAES